VIAASDFRLEAYFSRWEFNARYHLTASDAETFSLEELLALASPADRRDWDEQRLRYIESRGTPKLRQAIAATYDNVSADDVITFAGAEEGLFCAMHVLLEPGDHAIVLTPNYQSAESVPLSICEVTGIPIRPENGWTLDIEEIRAAIRPNTRVVSVNFPNNPTGYLPPEPGFHTLIELCDERGITLFSDEVHRGLERDARKRLPQAADVSQNALSLNVMSKAYGLPGLRVGWIACRRPALLERLEQAKFYLSICNAGPSEILARIALRAADTLLERNRTLTAGNLKKLDSFFARHRDRFDWYDPDGSCVAFPRYRGAEGADVFCARLVEEAGVLLVPGSIFHSKVGDVPEDRFRIGYGRSGIDEALSAFEQFLD